MITQTCTQLVSFCNGRAAYQMSVLIKPQPLSGGNSSWDQWSGPGNTYLHISAASDTGSSPVSAFFKADTKTQDKKKKEKKSGFS